MKYSICPFSVIRVNRKSMSGFHAQRHRRRYSKNLLSRRLRELGERLGEVSVEALQVAHSLEPDRFPDYQTVHKVLGGIMKYKRKREKA